MKRIRIGWRSCCAFWALTWYSLRYSYWLTLLLSVPTAGLLVRLFILQHDCGHGSFFKSKRLNDTVGFLLGVLVMTPYATWRRQHALHHAEDGRVGADADRQRQQRHDREARRPPQPAHRIVDVLT